MEEMFLLEQTVYHGAKRMARGEEKGKISHRKADIPAKDNLFICDLNEIFLLLLTTDNLSKSVLKKRSGDHLKSYANSFYKMHFITLLCKIQQ